MSMRFVFRADASVQIGTGHVMRCLTLADELVRQGHECRFVCREHKGHLGDLIADKGYDFTLLPSQSDNELNHRDRGADNCAYWLGVPWQEDARQTLDALKAWQPSWLVVDHYTLDAQWESYVRNALPGMRLMAIDDLADRPHQVNVLLDQNLGRKPEDYRDLVPEHCRRLIGPRHALLRLEFAESRRSSLQRRQQGGPVRRLLVSLGGVDKDNVTGQVLDAVSRIDLPENMEITVVMGASAPWLEEVRRRAKQMACETEVVVNVTDMAQRMAEADLAIGAAGSTSWERCCLGLPTIVLVLAENQRAIAQALDREGAAINSGSVSEKGWQMRLMVAIKRLLERRGECQRMALNAAAVTCGDGATLVTSEIKRNMLS